MILLIVLGLMIGYFLCDVAINVVQQRKFNAWRQDVGIAPQPIKLLK